MYRRTTRRIGLIPAASHLVRGRLESAFSLPDECVPVTGEPRVDVLSAGTPGRRRARATAAVEAAAGPIGAARLVLYAPTWRDGAEDPAIPAPSQWRLLERMLIERDAVLLIRSHPLGAGRYRPPGDVERVRAVGSDLVSDITPLLPAMDALITDYSSLAFDASLVPLPVVFLAPDLAAYTARRGMYGTYSDVAGDDWASTWEQAIAAVDAVLGDADERAERTARSAALSSRVHAFTDGGSAARVHRAVHARLAAAARGRRPVRSEGRR
ncbi:CDP-glycerol glycerophosphotransferase family protein [Microbacterium elymi]|uniref:CDP-glycerol glycerophosphotransferase family protein n=1 Tax=Microbacterium elymi TaxID=2909587 RepID=A0ABY5NK37_9MICO|nr:CDP-glycerol glycerophosphotransferase family protein [Microbacterium elymi]UUT35499.1 CDP-glycerol glycerophosphotransferase family protein [Microbacterium elymi]